MQFFSKSRDKHFQPDLNTAYKNLLETTENFHPTNQISIFTGQYYLLIYFILILILLFCILN